MKSNKNVMVAVVLLALVLMALAALADAKLCFVRMEVATVTNETVTVYAVMPALKLMGPSLPPRELYALESDTVVRMDGVTWASNGCWR